MEFINVTWLINLSLTLITLHGCLHRVPIDQFDFVVALGNWSDKNDRVYYTAAILKISELYIIAANAEILFNYRNYNDIKLMKWSSESRMVRGKVMNITERNAFVLITPEPEFINTKHFVKFHTKYKPKTVRLYIIQSYSPTDVSLTNLAVHPSDTCTDHDLPAMKYLFYWDNYLLNEVSCYRSVLGLKQSCVLDRGFLVLSTDFKYIYGIGLPYPELRCYRRVYARELWYLNVSGVPPSVTLSTSSTPITVSYYFLFTLLAQIMEILR